MVGDGTERSAAEDPRTEVVADDTTFAEVAALAWSQDTVPDEVVIRTDDRRPLPRPLLLLLGAVTAVALALAGYELNMYTAGFAGAPAMPTTTLSPTHTFVVAPPPPAPTVTVTAPLPPPGHAADPMPVTTADAQYLRYLRDNDVPYRGGDADAIVSAHEICSALQTRPVADETASVQRALGWSHTDAATLVGGAVAFYCPHLGS